MTTQLAMIVMITVHSNKGQLTNQVVSLRTGLEGVKRKREVGPGSATPSFFLPLASLPPMAKRGPGPAAAHQTRLTTWTSGFVLGGEKAVVG